MLRDMDVQELRCFAHPRTTPPISCPSISEPDERTRPLPQSPSAYSPSFACSALARDFSGEAARLHRLGDFIRKRRREDVYGEFLVQHGGNEYVPSPLPTHDRSA